MALLNPPCSTAVVDVPVGQVGAYVAQGWVEVAEPEAKKPRRSSTK